MRCALSPHPYEHPASRGYEREMLDLPKCTKLLAKVSGFRVGVVDGVSLPEVAFGYGSADMKLGMQQINEIITAISILLSKPS